MVQSCRQWKHLQQNTFQVIEQIFLVFVTIWSQFVYSVIRIFYVSLKVFLLFDCFFYVDLIFIKDNKDNNDDELLLISFLFYTQLV